jgi:insulysin
MNKIIEIKKPEFDNRTWSGGQLTNGIKFSIINDEHLEKSFVTVCLKVGSFYDPDEYQGLAHFLEHMLFMGSKKYPNENHYQTRLNELGGYSNAYTDVMETVYFFNVFDSGLEEIFDIFSRFFIDPLFDSDSVAREINAVNSEHLKNINQDTWRKYQLMLNLTDTHSMTNTFVTGSLNSLQKPDIRDQVIKFYNKYYTPENISISISSSKPTKQIYQIIANTFGHISTSNGPNEFSITKPFFTEHKSQTFHLKSVSNVYEINYIWEIPYLQPYIYSKDFNLLEMLITNKSDNSIYFHLKNRGYINGIYGEVRFEGVFIIKLKLTKDGFDNLDYINQVINFTLKQIQNCDFVNYAKYYQQVMKINFDCINKFSSEDLCNMLAVNHHYLPTQEIFIGSFTVQNIKTSSEYSQLFTKYLNEKNCIKIILSQNYNLANLNYLKLPEYGAEYALIPDNVLNQTSGIIGITSRLDNLGFFDTTNEYLDIEPKLIVSLDQYDVPSLVSGRQWYGGCSKFGEPQVRLIMQFNSNKFYNSPKSYILTNIYCSILNFISTVVLYKPLELCYSIVWEPNPTTSSICIKLSGLNSPDKLNKLVNDIQDLLTDFTNLFDKISENYINNLIGSFKDALSNTKYLNPWEYSSYIIRTSQITTEYPNDSIIKVLETLDYNTIKENLSGWLDGSALTTLVYGNIKPDPITKLFNGFFTFFNNPSYPLAKIKPIEPITITHPNIQEHSNCVCFYYPVGKFLPKDFILTCLVINIVSQPFFDDLRTKNQLGYLVKMGQHIIRDEHWIIQKIQSIQSVELVETKMDSFNKTLTKLIESADFDKFISTQRAQLKEPDYSLDEKVSRYYPEITLRQFLFNRNDILLEQLGKITRDDLIIFTKKIINKDNRIKIIINGN